MPERREGEEKAAGMDLRCILMSWEFLAVHWLRLCAFTVEALGLIPGWGTRVPQVCSQKQNKTNKKRKPHMNHNSLTTGIF